MKEKLSLYLVATVKRIGALWVGFLVSMIPVYILRGNIHDLDTLAMVERSTTTVIVLLTSAVLLLFLYRRDDHAAKLDKHGHSLLHTFRCQSLRHSNGAGNGKSLSFQ